MVLLLLLSDDVKDAAYIGGGVLSFNFTPEGGAPSPPTAPDSALVVARSCWTAGYESDDSDVSDVSVDAADCSDVSPSFDS